MFRALLISLVLACVSLPADACSCVQRTEDQHLALSTAAFDAVVVELRKEKFNGLDVEIAKMRVLSALKGPHKAGDLVEFRTATECCICGTSVQVGQRWRIFVQGQPPYSLSMCSGSYQLEDASQ